MMLMQNTLCDPAAALDVSLLCSKLEAAKREQDAALVQQQKRETVKSGAYFPRNAAKQLLATTMPMQERLAMTEPMRPHSASSRQDASHESQPGSQQQQPHQSQQHPQTSRPLLQLTTTNLCASPTPSPPASSTNSPRRGRARSISYNQAPPTASSPFPAPPPRANTLQTKIIPIKSPSGGIVYERIGLGTSIPSPTPPNATFPLSPPLPLSARRRQHDLDSIDLTRLVLDGNNAANNSNEDFNPPWSAGVFGGFGGGGGSATRHHRLGPRSGGTTKSRTPRSKSRPRTAGADGGDHRPRRAATPTSSPPRLPVMTQSRTGWLGGWRGRRDETKNAEIQTWSAEVLDVPGREGSGASADVLAVQQQQQKAKRKPLMGIFKRT